MQDLPPFPGFTPDGLRLLRDLRTHNDRDWFKPRKEQFDDALFWPARCLAADFARRAADLPLTGDPKRGLFRIYRDTRFSKDKRPYKTHLGLVLSRSGSRRDPGALYVHVEPDASFLAAGYWRPESALLRRWRSRIAAEPDAWTDVVERVAATGLEIKPLESLKRMPRGFEAHADAPEADWLRAKSFIAERSVPDEALLEPAFTEAVVQAGRDALPLLAWGWALLDGDAPAHH
ncbi:MAG: DUF2461 domain-containing protein [Rhodothermales bacterium]|nr:DUF2461 domain-containing protein [Rhodothermales bacterium]